MSTEPAAIFFKVPDEAFPDLGSLAQFAGKAAAVRAAVVAAGGYDSTERREAAALQVGLPSGIVERILDAVNSLHSILSRTGLTPGSLFDAMTRSIEADATPEWKAENLAKWKEGREEILRALALVGPDDPIVLQNKRRELTFAHQNIYESARLITEIRPVFNAAGDKMLEGILTHALVLRYQDGESSRRIEFALDLADVIELRRSCERAEVKVATTRKAYKSTGIKLRVIGGAKSATNPLSPESSKVEAE